MMLKAPLHGPSSRLAHSRDVRCRACHSHDRYHIETNETATCTRRGMLSAAAALTVFASSTPHASADDASLSSASREYRRTAQQLVKGMRDTIELELTGAEERQVRRKADESKVTTLVKDFISKWQDNPVLGSDPSKRELKEAVLELGAFYKQNGSRARLSPEVADSILSHLTAADAELGPMEEKKGMLSMF